MQMYTFVRFSVVILETPSKKAAVILSHLYVIGLKIVLRVKGGLTTSLSFFGTAENLA